MKFIEAALRAHTGAGAARPSIVHTFFSVLCSRRARKGPPGVEVLVGALLRRGVAADAGADGRKALAQLVDADPALRKRVERANGAKFFG